MENISDVEFGSDKGAEEAPILVAQRYLNIFKQIHIFKKEKRDQFDDELLALPQNIVDFFKRMPGGRLLVEHMEEVKTERGISFVKTDRSEFTNGETPANEETKNVPAVGGSTPVIGSNVVLDESFAETLANSMASAFKSIPAPQTGSVSTPLYPSANTGFSSDLGAAFDLITEEIRSSHSSFIDMLKETRNITESVIASQVTISRVLEETLSAHQQPVATPVVNNNGITEFQIGQILESFKADMRNEMQQSIAELKRSMEGIISQNTVTAKQFEPQEVRTVSGIVENTQKEAKAETFEISDNDNVSDAISFDAFSDEGHETEDVTAHIDDVLSSNIGNDIGDISADIDLNYNSQELTQTSDEIKKKKKKKKKKKNADLGVQGAAVTPTIVKDTYADVEGNGSAIEDTVSTPQTVDGVIRNSDYKYDDDFSHIHPEVAPLDIDDTLEDVKDVPADGLSSVLSEHDSSEDTVDDLDFALPERTSTLADGDFDEKVEQNAIGDNLETDGLDFALPERGSALSEFEQKDDIGHDADDSFSLDDITFDDSSTDNTTSAPEQDNAKDSNSSFSLDDFNFDEALKATDDTRLSEEDEKQEKEEPKEDGDGFSLDDFTFDNLAETTDDTDVNKQDDIQNDDDVSFDDYASDAPDDTEKEEITEQTEESKEEPEHNRYSPVLDKIRAALTSDDMDISSLDKPIALDDYDDNNYASGDEDQSNSSKDEDWEWEYVDEDKEADGNKNSADGQEQNSQQTTDSEDWEWEYVDENGNPVSQDETTDADDEDWEWEYVDEDGNKKNPDDDALNNR